MELTTVGRLTTIHKNSDRPARSSRYFVSDKGAVGWNILCQPKGRRETFEYRDRKLMTEEMPIYGIRLPFSF